MDEIQDFPRPVFRCPIREVKGAGTDYTAEDLIGGDTLDGSLCPTNVIGVIGVDEFGRIAYDWNAEGPVYGSNGEFELNPDNTLCVIIISGMMMAMEECVRPLCVAASGQFCLTMGTRGIECPDSC